MNKTITVETVVHADADKVWEFWNTPEHIEHWMHASDDWECPKAVNDLTIGGRFSFTFAAKDGSNSFNVTGVYTAIEENKHIAYTMDDARIVTVSFESGDGGVHIVETFEMEHENSEELQRSGWQAILDNFKSYVESSG
ncbi:MAG: hypothetical protein A3C84_04225 [Candidatus Ryanbacteria bacterium RIFCSPHIGHO2_02_FULL_48_12]|uniref:Activator of Hsp90 ATPase homologue 1/2-like C-terminal domain-containing protein n=1 Tax=Candidatus Ryanbacteria bacterium RIFCSPHIGHO2_01_FULL_48_27 TaxID=1802115 RepID=A0A1G2G5K2_9BACT|nr:MAG: hypothetical protein A2756_00730 [Candidatus Ryanbacteria bacterium RIFCSPHIGHO2_01_FULL_48_27]OGZ48570.1 MAG: hypothetical protein A3C84_04225 [Candidatus Ryanbacteria bacterium RIFCSPHIGHO2_02_FULL_48_12]